MTEIEHTPGGVELFSAYTVPKPLPTNRSRWFWSSVGIHTFLVLAVFLSPLFARIDMPPVDPLHAFIYNPPPPPPPPLPKGSSARLIEKAAEKTGAKPPDPDVLVEPKPPEDPKPVEPEKGIDPLKQFGSATGSDSGTIDGMEGGTVGGTVGGTLGGTLGGVIGGTGDNPVTDYDQAPRLLKGTKPAYPQEAFIKKIEGVVLLEIIIGVDGRVGRAKVLRSIPQLDAAAIQTVRQWLFAPAIKAGQPVVSLAQAPVSFHIY